ncbi:hypothetical protein FWF74_04005 [Candidatus Saccharibacteria bacterium]|nr:hypothetical protein [Candidatus Saccharibacteria bacterium]MCL1962780.1 hypothetical protein [Candidatus Saccharibacteria bacterium]
MGIEGMNNNPPQPAEPEANVGHEPTVEELQAVVAKVGELISKLESCSRLGYFPDRARKPMEKFLKIQEILSSDDDDSSLNLS